ncbi:hypothetical protein JWJ90_16925 [Desulfobulbus rhabdoformis]|uniref:hypothetical protein n=1 Tax=Desulfobulbus rhabdoformis TaxID=34032 RepID=UPI001966AD55|nr:hypothetical protein [Desulfobulbus rhabdoformis]MBM9615955.1 hypothetical protein [Desulfobulbus rhabdoformis]
MKELFLPPELSCEIGEIYESMVADYDEVAQAIGLTCMGCPDNCCDSYFLHYTYCEWAYLWEGIRKLDDAQIDRIVKRSRDYVEQSRAMIARQERPQIMCPLCDDGLCSVYSHRLLVCRTHGVPATLTRPDGKQMRFPGCFRCQEIVQEKYKQETDAPAMERTVLFQRLAQLEARFLGDRRGKVPRIKQTIAEMIVNGPPKDIK